MLYCLSVSECDAMQANTVMESAIAQAGQAYSLAAKQEAGDEEGASG